MTPSATCGARLKSHTRLRWVVPVAVSLGLAGWWALRYRPRVVVGSPAPGALALPGGRWPALPGLRLHVFNTGMNHVSPLLVGSPAPWRPVPAFVIEHPERGLIVFDCGLSNEVASRGGGVLHPLVRQLFQTRSRPGFDLATQMRAAGLDPGRVSLVVLSHLHFDHTGAARDFPGAQFVLDHEERAAGVGRLSGVEPGHTSWVAREAWRELTWSDARPYATFDRAVDLTGDQSVMLIAGGGHSAGDIAALVHLPGGPALLAGDAVVHFDWLTSDDVQRIPHDPERAAAVRNMVRGLRDLAPKVTIFPGHDLPTFSERSDIIIHEPRLFQREEWSLE
jgi:N-acyl homoserine lactone hydrolase